MAKNCTYIDGIASSQAIDTAGEVVEIKGLDISSLVGAALNWEHESKLPAQIVGKILEAKKIYCKEDCENERHLKYWNKCEIPFLYVMGRLFDDKKPSSVEVAALFKDDAEHPHEQPMLGFSVEGARLEKNQGMVVPRSIARKVTITNLNANKTCVAEMMPVKKAANSGDITSLFKGEMELFKFEPTYVEIMEKKEDLNKALEAGSGMAAPSVLSGGAAIISENLEKPKKKKGKSQWYSRADQAYSTWDKKEHFKSYMKKRMPHLAEGEIDSIGRVLALRKTLQAEGKLSKMYVKSYLNKNEELIKHSDIMMASEDYIHGLPKGHPALGQHKGHTYRRTAPPTANSKTWSWAVRSPEGKDSKVDLHHDTAGSRESIHAHIDSLLPKKS